MLMVWRNVIFNEGLQECGQAHSNVSRPKSLKILPHFGGSFRFERVRKLIAYLSGIVGLVMVISVYSPPALSEIEDRVTHEERKSGDVLSSLSHELMTNFLVDNYDSITDDDLLKYLSILNDPDSKTESARRSTGIDPSSHYKFVYSANENHLSDPLIPSAVWSLDASSGVHIDHIPNRRGSEADPTFGAPPDGTEFWTRVILRFWHENGADRGPDLLRVSPEFQVASCGGSDAEHSNLDYCNSIDINSNNDSNNVTITDDNSNNSIIQRSNSSVITSNLPSQANLESGSSIANLNSISADNLLLQGG